MTKLLIDGDMLIYRHAHGATEHVDWGNGLWVSFGNQHIAMEGIHRTIKEWQEQFKAKDVLLALSHKDNFRKKLCPRYKAQRRLKEPAVLVKILRQEVAKAYPTLEIPTLEADDVIGIEATKENDRPTIMISSDKDFKQIPGVHFNPLMPLLGLETVTKSQAEEAFLIQTLSGDIVDGYTGCPGIGKTKAKSILHGYTTLADAWERILTIYAQANLKPEDALHQARLAKILHAHEYCPKQGVRLWQPPQSIPKT